MASATLKQALNGWVDNLLWKEHNLSDFSCTFMSCPSLQQKREVDNAHPHNKTQHSFWGGF